MKNNLFMMILLLCQSLSAAKPHSDSGKHVWLFSAEK